MAIYYLVLNARRFSGDVRLWRADLATLVAIEGIDRIVRCCLNPACGSWVSEDLV